MSAFADILLALAGAAPNFGRRHNVNVVLREHAPCEPCEGTGIVFRRGSVGDHDEAVPVSCVACVGYGWTPASVEAAIVQVEERERLREAVVRAADRYAGSGILDLDKNEDGLISAVEAMGRYK